MRMNINETGGDDQAMGIDALLGGGAGEVANCGDCVPVYTDIAAEPGLAAPSTTRPPETIRS